MSSTSVKYRVARIDRVRDELVRRRTEEPDTYSWSVLEEDISSAAGHPVSRTAIRQFVAGGKPGNERIARAYDAWGVREGVLEPAPVPLMVRDDRASYVKKLGDQVRVWREAAGLTQGGLADRIDLDQSMVSRLERGLIKHPDPRVIERIREATGSSDDVTGLNEILDSSGINLPDVSYLLPRAREVYDAALGSYLTRGWPAQTIERAAWDLTNYIRGANILRSRGAERPDLTEDEQAMVIERARVHVESAYGPDGRGGRR